MKLTGSFVSVALLISSDLVVFVHFNLFFLLFRVLVYILINVINFLQNEHFVYIFESEKNYAHIWKSKVCMQINAFLAWWLGESEGTLKQMSFTCIKVTKRFVIVVFVERKDAIINNHLQSHVGKGTRYKAFCKYIEFCIKLWRPCKIHEYCLVPLMSWILQLHGLA